MKGRLNPKHVHTDAHVGDVYVGCSCGAVRDRYGPLSDRWHACRLCCHEWIEGEQQ